MDLAIVEFLQQFRNGFSDLFFSIITEFGDETVFFIISGILFWAVDKRFAYRLMIFFLATVLLTETLKGIITRQRPYAAPGTVVSVVKPTPGYSMPSGHAANSMILSLVLKERFGHLKKFVNPLLFTMAALVSLSRVYLGQHYISDVLAGMAVIILFYITVIKLTPKIKIPAEHLMLYLIPLYLFLIIFFSTKIIIIATAAILGVTIGHLLELKYIRYDILKSPLQRLLQVSIGLLVALILKEGLKYVLPYEAAADSSVLSHALDFIRYFIINIWLSLGSMALYKKILK